MRRELDTMIGLDRLNLYYEAHMLGIDGENFLYSVYFEDEVTEAKLRELQTAVTERLVSKSGDEYFGHLDIFSRDGKAIVFLDIGGAEPEYGEMAIKGVPEGLNSVAGIRLVNINED